MKDKYLVSAAPHVHDGSSIKNVMWNVVLALVPALVFAVYYWGLRALMLSLTGALSAVIAEALIQKWRKVPITVHDGSAFLTGLLLAFNIHVGAPIWLPMVGAVFAIGVGKQVFGGLGNNPVNPALLGRAFLLASWPTRMTAGWVAAKGGAISGINNLSRIATDLPSLSPKAYELLTGATPLNVAKTLRDTSFVAEINAKAGGLELGSRILSSLTEMETLKSLFWGNIGGCIGEVSAFALLLGAAYLLVRNIIEWRIPLFYIGTVFVLSFFFGGIGENGTSLMLPFFHIFAGGLLLGAFFMATDYTTTPYTKTGRIIFGIGCGLLTIVIRLVGGYPEGVSYSILLMNVFTPLIDKLTMPKSFGKVKK
ncbi:MAG: RnfABCDGE type electron transport complex subunit D [Candidatus Cloacimonetes bacterium]|nr:RnfABCDGE type electron transport complex subunit D [Candidatus Cloacimonadota bacterium]